MQITNHCLLFAFVIPPPRITSKGSADGSLLLYSRQVYCRLQKLQAVAEGILSSSIALDMPLMEAGLDSIGAVELRNAVSESFGIELPATVTFDYPSLEALASFIMNKMGAGNAQRGAGSNKQVVEREVQRVAAQLKQVAEGPLQDNYLYLLE